jgi:RNA polymerase sigma-70 factor (ECF subfamily)
MSADQPTTSPDELDTLPDEQLIQAYRGGRLEAFEMLVERYRQELFHFLARFAGSRAAAEDIFQEAFLQVHLSIDTFDTSRRFKPWLFTIAANKARDYLRKRKRRPAMPLSAPIGSDAEGQTFIDLMEADLPMPSDKVERDELSDRVAMAVDLLPDHLKEILLLAYFQKLSYNEIAEVLGIPLGTVKSRLHTAVGTFAEKWKNVNREENPSV